MANPSNTPAIDKDEYLEKTRFKVVIPHNLTEDLSTTQNCERCFALQEFSRKLQVFMIDYSLKVSSKNPLSDKP